jgi:hypothetical protein
MTTFSIGDTAVAGLRLAKNRPMALLYWFGLSLLVGGAGSLLMLSGVGSDFSRLAAGGAGGTADPKAVAQAMGRMLGAMGLLIPLYLVFTAMMTTAAVRAVLEPHRRAFGYLRLGFEELRTIVVMLALGVMMMLAYIALLIVFAVVGGAAIVGGAAAGGEAAGGALGILVMLVLGIAVFVGFFWFATRMSLAVPQTFANKSINIFGTWALTKGAAGKLFLAYLLAFLIYVALSMVAGLVNLALIGGSMASLGLSADASTPPDLSRIFATMGPALIVNLIISGVVGAIGMAVMVCPSAEAYRELGGGAASEAEVFA